MTERRTFVSPAWWDHARDDAYQAWRQQVLNDSGSDAAPVPLSDLTQLNPQEMRALTARLHAAGAVCYRTEGKTEPQDILRLGAQLGLTHLDHHQCAEADGVARLTARDDAAGRFIPYSRKRLRWHTDGYYQADEQRVRSFILHCVRPAERGGVNQWLDPRILYIALRDENPGWIRALTHPQAITIPAHTEEGEVRRAEFQGPVFFLEHETLCMRYTERAVHIRWHPDTEDARDQIQRQLAELPQARRKLRLDAGCGLIAHNVLHCRSAFTDHPDRPRLLYRARYADRAHLPC